MVKDPNDTIKVYQCLEQIINDLTDHVYTYEDFDWSAVEKIILKNVLEKFNNTQTEKLTGLCRGTIRNKKNEYGLRDIQKDSLILLKKASEDSSRETP